MSNEYRQDGDFIFQGEQLLLDDIGQREGPIIIDLLYERDSLQNVVAGLGADTVCLKAELAERDAALAWLVTAVIQDTEIAATPDKEAWLRRAKQVGALWCEQHARDSEHIQTLTASRSALEREVERLQRELAKIRDCTSDMWACAFASAILAGDSTEDALKAAERWENDGDRHARAEVDRLTTALPRVAEATRNAAEAALIPLPRRSHVYGHECLFFEQASRAILDLDVSAIIAQLHAGAGEVREVDSK